MQRQHCFPCRFAGKVRIRRARLNCRRKAQSRYSTRVSYKCVAAKVCSLSCGDVLSNPEYVAMLKQDSLAGGAARSVFHRRKKDQTQPGDLKMQNDVTRNLISTLKGCLNQGMSLQQILKAAEAWVEKPSKLKQKPKPKRAKGRTKTPHSTDAPDIGYWKDQNGQWRHIDWIRMVGGTGVMPKFQTSTGTLVGKDILLVASHETVGRVDTSISSSKNDLRSGEKIPGNVVEVWSEAGKSLSCSPFGPPRSCAVKQCRCLTPG